MIRRYCKINLLLLSFVLFIGCATGTEIRDRSFKLEKETRKVLRPGYFCSPKNLAYTLAYNDFTRWETHQGNFLKARKHIVVAEKAYKKVMADIYFKEADTGRVRLRTECLNIKFVDRDTDLDTIMDSKDECPLDKADAKGLKLGDGCPYPIIIKKPKLIVITKTKIELTQKIFFELDKDTIMPVSFPILNEIIDALKQRPTMMLRIEGHTCIIGGALYNMKLSDARSKSVRRYLIEKGGIDPTRLTAKGYGLTRPIDDNRTEKGRERNRRVEFFIIAQ